MVATVFAVLVKMMGIALEYSAMIVFMAAVLPMWLVSKIAFESASMELVADTGATTVVVKEGPTCE